MPLSPPAQYELLLGQARVVWGITRLEFLRELSDGQSTAHVLLVDIETNTYSGHAVLKLDEPYPGSAAPAGEAAAYEEVRRKAPDFAGERLPSLLSACQHENQIALLCTIPGKSINQLSSVFEVSPHRQANVAELVARELLERLNHDYRFDRSALPPSEVLQAWLGYRLHPEDGRIHRFISEVPGFDPKAIAFSYEGRFFPNPCPFSTEAHLWLNHENQVIRGRLHGDLHGGNILVPKKTGHEYYLIDLALYKEDALLFYDHAYFELGYLLRKLRAVSFPNWLNLLQAALDNSNAARHQVDLGEKGYRQFLQRIRRPIWDWILANQNERQDHVRGQAILARVAAGLNFVNKTLSSRTLDDKHRVLAFLYASLHLSHYLETFQIRWEQRGPEMTFQDPQTTPKKSIRPVRGIVSKPNLPAVAEGRGESKIKYLYKFLIARPAVLENITQIADLAKEVNIGNTRPDLDRIKEQLEISDGTLKKEISWQTGLLYLVTDLYREGVVGSTIVGQGKIQWAFNACWRKRDQVKRRYGNYRSTRTFLEYDKKDSHALEIAGNTVVNEYRGQRIASFQTAARMLFLHLNEIPLVKHLFADLLTDRDEKGAFPFFEDVIKPLLGGMDYDDADKKRYEHRLSGEVPFLNAFFEDQAGQPPCRLIIELLPERVQRTFGIVKEDTKRARKSLERFGFKYNSKHDVLDGGLYVEASMETVKKRVLNSSKILTPKWLSVLPKESFWYTFAPNGRSPKDYICVRARAIDEDDSLFVEKDVYQMLGLKPEDQVVALEPERGTKNAGTEK